MVAPAYAAKRSELAKTLGLGSLRKRQGQAVEAVPEPEPSADKKRRGSKTA